jgi:hypothetical protein
MSHHFVQVDGDHSPLPLEEQPSWKRTDRGYEFKDGLEVDAISYHRWRLDPVTIIWYVVPHPEVHDLWILLPTLHTPYKVPLRSGRYGDVFNAGSQVTIKEMDCDQHASRECLAYGWLSLCPYVPRLYDVVMKSEDDPQLTLIMEQGAYTLGETTLSTREYAIAFYQLLEGLSAFHGQSLVHGDIKANNILYIAARKRWVWCDLGMCHFLTHETSHEDVIHIPSYRAPELRTQDSYDTGVDIWAMARMMIHTLLPEGLFTTSEWLCMCTTRDETKYNQALEIILQRVRTCLPHQELFVSLLSRMLTWDPADRINASVALLHPYFQSVPRQEEMKQNESALQRLPEVDPSFKRSCGILEQWLHELAQVYDIPEACIRLVMILFSHVVPHLEMKDYQVAGVMLLLIACHVFYRTRPFPLFHAEHVCAGTYSTADLMLMYCTLVRLNWRGAVRILFELENKEED